MPIFEIFAEGYGWTLNTCLWSLTLPQMFQYLEKRHNRIKRENDVNSGDTSSNDISEAHYTSASQRQKAIEDYQDSIKDENALPIDQLLMGLGMS